MADSCLVLRGLTDFRPIIDNIKESLTVGSLFDYNGSIDLDILRRIKSGLNTITTDFGNNDTNLEYQDLFENSLFEAIVESGEVGSLDLIRNQKVFENFRNLDIEQILETPKLTNSKLEYIVPRLDAHFNNLFVYGADFAKFLKRFFNLIIRNMFIGKTGVVTNDSEFSNNMLEMYNELIEYLVDSFIDILEDSKDEASAEALLSINADITILENIDMEEAEDRPRDTKKRLNTLFRIADNYFASKLLNGKFYSNSINENRLFLNYIMARDFDTFVNTMTEGMVSVKLGMFNTFKPNKYVMNIAKLVRQEWNDNIHEFTDNSNKLVLYYLRSLNIPGLENVYVSDTDFTLVIAYIHNNLGHRLGELRNNPDTLISIWEDAVIKMENDRTITKLVKQAARTIYNNVFNPKNANSLYFRYKNKGDIKYNLFNLISNSINTATTMSYLQSGFDEDGNYVVQEYALSKTLIKTKGIELNIMLNTSKLDLNSLDNVVELTTDDNKTRGFRILIGDSKIDLILEENTILVLYNNKRIYQNNEKVSLINSLGDSLRNITNEILGTRFDASYWDILISQDPSDSSKIFNILAAGLTNAKISSLTSKLDEDTALEVYDSIIKNQFPAGVVLSSKGNEFDSGIKLLKVRSILGSEGAVKAIAKTNNIINGQGYQSFIVDDEGKKLPNMTITSAMNDDEIITWRLANKVDTPFNTNPFKYNLFSENKVLGKTTKDQSVNTGEGSVKNVAKLTSGELAIRDFLDRYLANKDTMMYVQPTTYADKSSIWVKYIFLNEDILQNNLGFTDEEKAAFLKEDGSYKTLNEMSIEDILNLHKLTMRKQFEVYNQNFADALKAVMSILGVKYKKNGSYLSVKNAFNKANISHDRFLYAINLARKNGQNIEIFPEALYKVEGGIVKFKNNTFDYFTYLYNNDTAYKLKINIEKKLYAQVWLKDNNHLYIADGLNKTNPFIKSLAEANPEWVNPETQEVIPFKIKKNGKEITRLSNDDIYDEGVTIEMHPELDRYFHLNGLIADNYNALLFGFPYAHKGKSNIDWNPSKLTNINYLKQLKTEEAARTTAKNKRGVIGGATIYPFRLNLLNGIRSEYNIAVIDDIAATVFNLLGTNVADGDKALAVTPHDGAIWCNPFTSILEINSVAEIALSGVHKKPICHFDKSQFGVAGLLKCATFALNNAYIRESKSIINGDRLLAKMADIPWNDDRIDLTSKLYGTFYKDPVTFLNYRINSLTKVAGNTYKVNRTPVDVNGKSIGESEVYQTEINSNYQLWKVLGGEYSKSLENGKLVWSEASIEKTVDYMNKQSFLKDPSNPGAPKSQQFYDLPMKAKLIDYLANQSAVKNGMANVNSSKFYYNDTSITSLELLTDLVTMSIDTNFLGVQLNADHDLSDAEVSEMTQVIAAMEQKGLQHGDVYRIYDNIGRNILKQLLPYVDGLDLSDEDAFSELYNILGRLLIYTYGSRNQVGLTQAYLLAVKEDIESNKKISDLARLIPFDDPNISSVLLTGFTSGINKEIIRREYDGIAAVQAPSHNLVMIYLDSNGRIIKYSDLMDSSNSLEEFNTKLAALDRIDIAHADVFEGDYVRLVDRATGEIIREGRILSYRQEDGLGLRDILDLRNNPNIQIDVLGSKGRNIRGQNFTFEVNGTRFSSFDLDSSKLAWDLRDMLDSSIATDAISFYQSIESPEYQIMFKEFRNKLIKYSLAGFDNAVTNYLINKSNSNYKVIAGFMEKILEDDLANLHKNLVSIPVSSRQLLGMNINDNNLVYTTAPKYSANEILLGKLYAHKFRIEKGDQLSTIHLLKEQFFINKLSREIRTDLDSKYYDAYYTRANGNHLYIITDKKKYDSLVKDDIIKPQNITIAPKDGRVYRVEDGKTTYPVDKAYQFGIIHGTNEQDYKIVYVPKNKLIKFTEDMESSEEFSTLQTNLLPSNLVSMLKLVTNSKFALNPIKTLFREFSKNNITSKDFLTEYNNKLQDWTESHLIKRGLEMFLSFNLYLQFVGARIPAQSMQSYMNMEVVGFIDTDTNIIFNPNLFNTIINHINCGKFI